MSDEMVEENKFTKDKKQRKESLLFKYGIIAFFEILVIVSAFLIFITRNIKAPIKGIYDESVDNFMDSAIDNVQSWFEDQVNIMNIFQRAVVDPVDSPAHIKERIKTVTKPDGYEYVMVFWDSDTSAQDGGPATFNTKGGFSTAGILQKEYYVNHKKSNVDVWLESPRVAAAGGYTMPLYVKSEFTDARTGQKTSGGCVGFLELTSLNKLDKSIALKWSILDTGKVIELLVDGLCILTIFILQNILYKRMVGIEDQSLSLSTKVSHAHSVSSIHLHHVCHTS